MKTPIKITASQIELMRVYAQKENKEITEENILGFYMMALQHEIEVAQTIVGSHNRGVGKMVKDQMCEEVYNELRVA